MTNGSTNPPLTLAEKYDKLEVSYDHKEKQEQFLFSWCGKKFIQLGKLNGITATGATKVAAGKSMLCNLFMACSLIGEMYDKREKSHVLKCLVRQCVSLYVDAEMGRSSTQAALWRIKLSCADYGVPSPYRYKKRTKAISFDGQSTEEILEAIQYYIVKYRPNVVYIDNMVFLLNNMDVNDPTSALRIAEIDSWCKKYDTTIVLVAHGNKSADDTNIAGSAGTMMMRLTAYILAIQEGEVGTPGKFKKVATLKARQGGFDGLPDMTFFFTPFIYKDIESVYPTIGQPLEDPNPRDLELFNAIFGGSTTKLMRYAEMVESVKKYLCINDKNAEKHIHSALRYGIIVKNGEKRTDPYRLILPSLPSIE